MRSTLKNIFAAYLLDAPRYALALRRSRPDGWMTLHNRGQRLERRPEQRGVYVAGDPWTSSLFYCQAYPYVGLRVLRTALAEWPIEFRSEPLPAARAEPPRVSFIMGHRGPARVPHLLTTLRSLAGQEDVPFECLVVEQAVAPELPAILPAWVRHLHTPLPYPDLPYSRAWAFNCGARAARGEYLVFHDNDICVPKHYARELALVFQQGFEAARLLRFLFYLAEAQTQELFRTADATLKEPPLEIVQNCAGGTLAVRRDVYFAVGGHDEMFLGWGGEDNEMFDRLRTRRLHDCSYLPFLHLHHAPQPRKAAHPNTSYFQTRSRLPAPDRIAELVQRGFGLPQGPIVTNVS
jgi:N-terminal domain of galactosyltransferase/Glycosyl transferase family 2